MKIGESGFNETVMGAEEEMAFSIDDSNSVIFDILRDKMYSNKIGSICREVASNSRDANREAGNADMPTEIKIIEPKDELDLGGITGHLAISFKDYGTGITPDRMADVFVKYGASTKRSTNSQTGGFGLGAKTPFAYTDTFTIITTCMVDGKMMKYIYTAMIDGTRKGKMIRFSGDEVFDQVTGTQIVVPINNPVDRARFEKECHNYLRYWPKNEVQFINFEKEDAEVELIADDKQYAIFKDDRNDNYALIIDGVPYPLDSNVISLPSSGIGDKYVFALKFGVGQLTVSANREAVQYDDITIKRIQGLIERIQPKLFRDFEKIIESKCTSYLGAAEVLYTISAKQHDLWKIEDPILQMVGYAFTEGTYSSNRGLLHEMRKTLLNKKRVINGVEVKSRIYLKHHKLIYVMKPRSGDRTKYDEVKQLNFNPKNTSIPFYYGDKKRNVRRNMTIWEKENSRFALIVAIGDDIQGQMNEM